MGRTVLQGTCRGIMKGVGEQLEERMRRKESGRRQAMMMYSLRGGDGRGAGWELMKTTWAS